MTGGHTEQMPIITVDEYVSGSIPEFQKGKAKRETNIEMRLDIGEKSSCTDLDVPSLHHIHEAEEKSVCNGVLVAGPWIDRLLGFLVCKKWKVVWSSGHTPDPGTDTKRVRIPLQASCYAVVLVSVSQWRSVEAMTRRLQAQISVDSMSWQ